MNIKISVVTVCYNAESEIEKTMQSVLKQNYQNIEYVIKDGYSKDNTNQIINKYKSLFEKKGISLQHIVSKDRGIYDAMNVAVKNCSGDWVIFMNAGDLFYNEAVIDDVFNRKDWSGVDVIYGHTLLRLSEKKGYITNHSADFLEAGMTLCHQSLFVRKELLRQYPFDCQYKIKADYDQMLRLKRNGCVFTRVNAIISDRDLEGVSNKMTKLCDKEDNMLMARYGLNWKKKNSALRYIKEMIKKLFPTFFMIWSMQKRGKNIIKFK